MLEEGFEGKWVSENLDELAPAKRNETLEFLKKAELQREKEKEERQLEKSREASSIWDESRKASSEHSYLKRKKISADGLKQDGDGLWRNWSIAMAGYNPSSLSILKAQRDSSRGQNQRMLFPLWH